VRLRGEFQNARVKFLREKKGRVAFIGGSITEMEGYRPMVCELLKKRFPETEFTFTAAGIGSTCSTTGAFRLASDVFGAGPVDLLFVEFAVNDDQDAEHTRAECIRGMEGIVRHARAINPNVDIVITFFVNEGMLKTLREKKTPLTVEAHEAVAEHYQIPSINLAKEVAEEVEAGRLTWKQYGGVHPAPYGNAICARMIDELFERAWGGAAPAAAVKAHAMPEKPLDPFNYERGRFIDPKEAKAGAGWTLGVPDWSKLPGSTRARFTKIPMLVATEPGAELTLAFEGTSVGAYVVAGPDAGVVEASVDGGPVRKVDLYHRFSKGLHYPRTVMLGTELPPGKHVLKVRVSGETHSTGHAVRVMEFGVN
jgi:lysophospholipase L1-like esterase